MFKLSGNKRILLLLFVLLILAAPVFAQENQGVTLARETATSQPAFESNALLINQAQNQRKQLAALANKLVAEKEQQLAKDLRTLRVTSSDAVQKQPAAPAADGDAARLAKKLANPLASLISFPMQSNFDFRMGTGSGWRYTLNLQPVVPVALNAKWNLISRTIIPIIHQANVTAPGAGQSGLGDSVQSIFFSPNKSEPFIWGVGPAILIPTATNQSLGSKQLALGPTAVGLKQRHGWTVGMLWNHLWRVTGGSGRPRVNADFIQPFLSYSTKDGWSYGINTESTYDWTGNSWSVPVHFTVQKIVRFGKQPIQFGGAMRCWATSPSGGPEGCGLRIIVTGIFPKK